MRRFWFLATAVLSLAAAEPALAQPNLAQPQAESALRIEWEVKNRFRLFRNEADFRRHAAATRGDGVLAAEQRLARATDGRGWARDMVDNLCVDRPERLPETCQRDGERENLMCPADHRIGIGIVGACRRARCAPGPSTTAKAPAAGHRASAPMN